MKSKKNKIVSAMLWIARVSLAFCVIAAVFSAIASMVFEWYGPPSDALLWGCVGICLTQVLSDSLKVRA